MARWRAVLAGLWAGMLLAVALLATPVPFATLAPADAGRVVARVLAHEAMASLAFGAVLLLLERAISRRAGAAAPQFSAGLALVLGAILCTVVGYYVVQPQIVAARHGAGVLSVMQWHAVAVGFYLVKTALVLALAWRGTR